jgi:hypothetical protein
VVSAISAGTSRNSVDYIWHLTKISPDLETKYYDYHIGLTNWRGMNGPRSMCQLKDFIITGGAVTVTTADSQPYATVMTLNDDGTIANARNYFTNGKLMHN